MGNRKRSKWIDHNGQKRLTARQTASLFSALLLQTQEKYRIMVF